MDSRISRNFIKEFYFPLCTFQLRKKNFKIQTSTRRKIKKHLYSSAQRFEIPSKSIILIYSRLFLFESKQQKQYYCKYLGASYEDKQLLNMRTT